MKKLLLFFISLVWVSFTLAQSGTWVVYNTSNSDLPSDKIESLGFEGTDTWVGTYDGGVAEFDGANWTVYNSSNSSLPIDRVLSIAINGNDKWFGTTWGLANLDATDTWTVYHTGDGLPHEYVSALLFDGSGDLLVGTGGGGLAKYDLAGDAWTTLLAGQNVTDIDIDSDGDLWVATYANGVYYLEPDGTELGHYTTSNSDLPHNRVLSIAIDGSDNKWIGCHWLGIGKLADDNSTWTLYKESNSDLPDNKVNSIDVDTNDDVWFATDGGLAVFDGSDWTIYDTGTSTMPSDLVEVIRITSGGDEWAGTWGGGLAEHDILGDDLGITAISAPASGVGLTATEDVTVTITNFGNNSQNNFDVSFSVDGGAATTETVAGPIAAGATLDYTFTAQADLSAYATFSIEASTELVGDEDNSNDPETVSLTNTPPAPTFTGASQDGYDIDLSWDAWGGSAIDNFKVYRDGVEIGTAAAGAMGYTDSDGFTPGTTYEYYITVIKGSLESASSDDTLSVTYQYHTCTPDLSAVTDEHIDDVTFGGIDNENTGTYISATDGYSDYTDIYAEFIRDETYTLEVTFEDNTSPNSDPYGIWVDWNGNGVFEEASDTTITGNLNFAPGTTEITKSHDLTVPAGAASTALLRIMHINSGTVDPCLVQNVVGEVEDYSLTIFDAPTSTYYDFDGGNPADPTYTIYFQQAQLNGNNLQPYDELAVYDNDTLVGAMQLTQVCTDDNWDENVLIAFQTISETGDGYTPGQDMIFKAYDHSAGEEHTLNGITYLDPAGDAWTSSVFPSGDGEYSIVEAGFYETYFDFTGGDSSDSTWTIYIWDAEIDGVNIEQNDEIAIFDGTKMVGHLKLLVAFNENSEDHELTAYQTLIDGSAGYTSGNPVVYKLWDYSAGEEVIYYTLDVHEENVGTDYMDEIFPTNDGEVSYHEIDATSTASIDTQTILLQAGYQFASTYINPFDPQDYDEIIDEVLGAGTLRFVRNTGGDMLQKIGSTWVNGIGDWVTIEGYLYRMYSADTVTVNGSAVDPDATDIEIVAGYQFISYLRNAAQDAETSFGNDEDGGAGTYDDLLDGDTEFIRDSDGNILHQIGATWINGIGNLEPGEGYLVKRDAAAPTITFQYPDNAKSLVNSGLKLQPQHFIFEGGNAADPVYTLYIEPGQNVNIGDEVAAFANGNMVGSTVIRSENAFTNAIAAFSTLNSGKGYEPGDELTLKRWDKESGQVSSVAYQMSHAYEAAYTGYTYPDGDGVYSIVKAGIAPDAPEKEAAFNLDVYPNPADNNVHINSSITIDEVRIMNPIGQTIKHVTVADKNLTIDLSALKEGLYLIEVISGDETTVKKLVVR